jgi:UDP-2,3-diacylglucosamine pyrophosphatase LpxH
MLVLISDLHLTDGTSGETINAGAFGVFRERLRDMAYDASWRADGSYKPVKECHILLLGDILDLIRSTKWPSEKSDPGYVRPWHDPQSKVFENKISEIADGVLKHNAKSLAILKSLTKKGAVAIPPATPGGKPKKVSRDPGASDRVPVDVQLHYLVGNHDWFLHLPGPKYDEIRKRVIKAIGLKNGPGPFPHDPAEYPQIESVYKQHQFYARHGDIHDPMNYEGDRNASSLGDAIVTDIVDRFAVEVKKQYGKDLPKAVIEGLKEIDNVRPLMLIPAWVDGLLKRTCPDESQQKAVKGVWDSLVDDFLSLDFVRARSSLINPFNAVFQLRFGLRLSQGLAFRALGSFVTWMNSRSKGGETYSAYALKEPAFLNRTARRIVYGHTHYYEIRPLDVWSNGKESEDQVYINSGTWRAVHDQTMANPRDHLFVSYKVMTYLAFFKDDERGGQTFEAWNGALAAD